MLPGQFVQVLQSQVDALKQVSLTDLYMRRSLAENIIKDALKENPNDKRVYEVQRQLAILQAAIDQRPKPPPVVISVQTAVLNAKKE